jgi:UDP:flavonoid glycosyltransferase YjiC (YdhE family)
VVCLLPDAGHAIPLLRIAKQIEVAGGKVRYFGTAETRQLAESFGIHAVIAGGVRPSNHRQLLERMANANPVYRRIRLEKWFYQTYFQPLMENAFRQLPNVQARVVEFRPSVVLADEHIFRGAYKTIAEACNAPLVLHRAYGSNYSPTPAANAEWLTGSLDRHPRLIELCTKVMGAVGTRFARLFAPATFGERERQRQYIEGHWSRFQQIERSAVGRTSRISTGLGPLETKYLANKDRDDEILQFGAVAPLAGQQECAEILQWLDAPGATKTLYVSFGTMAPTGVAFGRSIVEAALRFGARVLWASPHCPWGSHPSYPSDKVRWEKWLPQPRVLMHPSVTAFLTHAGSGALQEALWSGKPVVCIPLMWDQPYNAWVARKLGFGCVVDKQHVTTETVLNALLTVHSAATIANASSLGAEMRSLAGAEAVTAYFLSL